MKFLLEQDNTPCGVEIDGQCYGAAEIERIVRAARAWSVWHDASEGQEEADLIDALNSFVSVLQNPTSDASQDRRCAVAGCEKRVYSTHRYCTMHRLRMERTGDPNLARKRGPKGKEA